MECTFNHVNLDGIAAAVPAHCIRIEDELKFFDNNPKKLARAQKIIGYGQRHVVEPGTTALDLCEAAGRKLIREMDLNPDSIDTLIVVNQSPDYFFPSGSCLLHGRLGLSKSCATFDVSLGCSGYVHGLWLAHALIASGASKKLLLLAGDTPSLHSVPRNRLTNPLFGDAGTATLLSYTAHDNPAYFVLGTDGNSWQSIIMPGGAFRHPPTPKMLTEQYRDQEGNPWQMNQLLLDGMEVFNFTLTEIPPSIHQTLSFANISLDSIDFIALHQANKQIVNALAIKLGLPVDAVSTSTFSRYGNQSTASVPCVLCHELQEIMPQHSMLILLSAFGVGLSWANALITCNHAYNGGIELYHPLCNQQNLHHPTDWAQLFLTKGTTQ